MKAEYWRHAEKGDYAVIGDPVGHSLSPRMHMAAYQHLGLDLTYRAIHVPMEELDEALDSLEDLGYRGINITLPLKERALAACRKLEGPCELYGATNTMRLADRAGINTDAPGFIETVKELGIAPAASVLLIGAGATARTLAHALREYGCMLTITNRTMSKAQALANIVGAEVMESPSVAGFDLVLNTSSAGLSGESMAIDWTVASEKTIAYDVVYGDGLTPFLAPAHAHGLRTIDGRSMLVAQGAQSFEWWLGQPAPRNVMREAIA